MDFDFGSLLLIVIFTLALLYMIFLFIGIKRDNGKIVIASFILLICGGIGFVCLVICIKTGVVDLTSGYLVKDVSLEVEVVNSNGIKGYEVLEQRCMFDSELDINQNVKNCFSDIDFAKDNVKYYVSD